MLDSLTEITTKNPVDLIISQLRDLISSGSIKPGERLPSERKLADAFNVSRGPVREAINKLQFYGILKVVPQSGTIVSGIGITALEGLMSDILRLEKADIKSLIDTRLLLEKEAARLAAINRTAADIASLADALDSLEIKLSNGDSAVEEDLLFHIRIGEASNNAVLKSLMMILTPDIVKNFVVLKKVFSAARNEQTIVEHRKIFDAIVKKDQDAAVQAMEDHLSDLSFLEEQ